MAEIEINSQDRLHCLTVHQDLLRKNQQGLPAKWHQSEKKRRTSDHGRKELANLKQNMDLAQATIKQLECTHHDNSCSNLLRKISTPDS